MICEYGNRERCLFKSWWQADPDFMQAQLLDSFYGIDRGLQANTEVRAEISELITRLEAHNPTPSPNEVRACTPFKFQSSLVDETLQQILQQICAA